MKSHSLPLLGAAALVSLAWSATASAAEYRLLTTADGRELACEVLATTASGLQIAVPQGEMLIPFTLLRDMRPIDQKEYSNQDHWVVHIPVESPNEAALAAAVTSIPNLSLLTNDESMDTSVIERIEACGMNKGCIQAAAGDQGWIWVLTATEADPETELFSVNSYVTSGSAANSAAIATTDPADVQQAVASVMELTSIKGGAMARQDGGKGPKTPRVALSRNEVIASSFIPVPGYSSMRQGDMAGFGMSCAVVVPATAAMVVASGRSNNNPAGQILMSLGGYYATTVLTNQIFGLRSFNQNNTAVSLAPTEDGGVTFGIHGQL